MPTPPTYDLNSDAGRSLLNMTLNAGNSGQLGFGINAFLGNDYQPTGDRTSVQGMGWDPGNVSYNLDPMLALGDRLGYTGDASQLRGLSGGTPKYNPDGTITPATPGQGNNTYDAYTLYKNGLDKYINDKGYVNVSGMSSGWDGTTGDPRSAATTLYQNQGNVLTPAGDPHLYHARERGSWAQENQDGVMAALILGGGFLGGSALAAYGAGGAGAGAAGAGAGAAPGAGAAGATAGGGSGLGGTLGSLQSWYAGLPAWGQGALSGAAQGGISSGIQGKNILQGAGIGALTGGLGGWGGSALAGATGLPNWAARALVSSGTGGLGAGLSGGDWRQGALAGGLGSLAGSGLSEAGLSGQIAGRLGGMLGNYGAGAILGPTGNNRGTSGNSPGSTGAGGLSGGATSYPVSGGGLLQGSPLGAAAAQQKAYLTQAYAPIVADAKKKALKESLIEGLAED